MKWRDWLLRLKWLRVDELKRRVATLDEMRTGPEKKLADLDDTVVRERQRASDSEIGRLAFPSFLQSIEVRRKNMQNTQKDLERERALQQDDLAAAFQDLKSFELAEGERVRRAAEAEGKAAQSRLDEMAMTRHLRKHAGRQA